jgi:hypothetical protein
MKPRTVALAVATAVAALAPAAPAAAAAPSVKISVTASPITKALSTKPSTTRVAVTNTGTRRVRGLAVSVTSARGVSVRVSGARKPRGRTRSLRPLKAGGTVRVGVSLRRTRTGPKRGHLTVKVTRRGKTVATGRLDFGAAPGSAPAQPVDPNSLAGRYFWGSLYTLSGIEQYTLYFAGPNLVYTAATESAWPACTAVTDVCKSYAYNAAANALTIDGKPATLAGRGLTLDGQSYREFGFPPAGTRWDATVTYSNSTGLCPLYCSYYTENLTFRPDGTFLRDAVSSGTGPIVDWAAVPPDRKGTYEVRADHTLRLAFADGTERIETVAQYLNDDGTLQAPGEGLLLGGDGYFDIDT